MSIHALPVVSRLTYGGSNIANVNKLTASEEPAFQSKSPTGSPPFNQRIDSLAHSPTVPPSIKASAAEELRVLVEGATGVSRFHDSMDKKGEWDFGSICQYRTRTCDFYWGEYRFAFTLEWQGLSQIDGGLFSLYCRKGKKGKPLVVYKYSWQEDSSCGSGSEATDAQMNRLRKGLNLEATTKIELLAGLFAFAGLYFFDLPIQGHDPAECFGGEGLTLFKDAFAMLPANKTDEDKDEDDEDDKDGYANEDEEREAFAIEEEKSAQAIYNASLGRSSKRKKGSGEGATKKATKKK